MTHMEEKWILVTQVDLTWLYGTEAANTSRHFLEEVPADPDVQHFLTPH